jgi:hypothetical protein
LKELHPCLMTISIAQEKPLRNIQTIIKAGYMLRLKEPLPYLAFSHELEHLLSSLGTKGSEHSLR